MQLSSIVLRLGGGLNLLLFRAKMSCSLIDVESSFKSKKFSLRRNVLQNDFMSVDSSVWFGWGVGVNLSPSFSKSICA